MHDQAQGLRELARTVDAKGGAFEAMGLPAVFDAKSITDDLITYRRLWLDQKADLERWKSVGGFDKPENLSTENLATMWEMMQRREEQR